MEIVKKTDTYMIVKKRSGRFGVRSMNRSWINGPEKERILSEAGLLDKTPDQSAKQNDEQLSDSEESSEDAERDGVVA